MSNRAGASSGNPSKPGSPNNAEVGKRGALPTNADPEEGAWQAILHYAVQQITHYLATTVDAFDPDAVIPRSMLTLLDHASLWEVVMQRNYERLCGRIGCAAPPRALQTAALCEKSPSEGSFDTEEEEEGKKTVDEASASGERRCELAIEGDMHRAVQQSLVEEDEEVVYEDDFYTQESFRLARRLQRQLHRLHRTDKRWRERHQKRLIGSGTAPKGGLAESLFGAPMPERFCSVECLDLYKVELRPRVESLLLYDEPRVLGAIQTLYPNLPQGVLEQLEKAEKTLPSRALSEVVVENKTATLLNRDSELARHTLTTMRSANPQQLWNGKAMHRLGMLCGKGCRDTAGLSVVPALSNPSNALSGALFVVNFLQALSSNETKQLFLLLYVKQRDAVVRLRTQYALASARNEQNGEKSPCVSFTFLRILEPVLNALEAKAVAGQTLPPEALSFRLTEQQQRRCGEGRGVAELFVAERLARLLAMDIVIVEKTAWEVGWQRTGLLRSLCTPATLQQQRQQRPEAVGLSLAMLLAVVPIVTATKEREELWEALASAEEELVELLRALGMTEKDLRTALHALMVGGVN